MSYRDRPLRGTIRPRDFRRPFFPPGSNPVSLANSREPEDRRPFSTPRGGAAASTERLRGSSGGALPPAALFGT